MSELLIFGGTAEGRTLAEYCAVNGIYAAVSAATDYGSSLLPESRYIRKLTGRLDASGISGLLERGSCRAVIDATHPYAVEASANIRYACEKNGVRYVRLKRESTASEYGISAADINALPGLLNSSEGIILSTLGSKELPVLTKVKDYRRRLFIRVLLGAPAADFGIPPEHVIEEKGPFSVEQNIAHIRQTGAEILLTKESGAAGGYPEKARAAEMCGIALVTVLRPKENGYELEEVLRMLPEL